jgi:hypothetical protein
LLFLLDDGRSTAKSFRRIHYLDNLTGFILQSYETPDSGKERGGEKRKRKEEKNKERKNTSKTKEEEEEKKRERIKKHCFLHAVSNLPHWLFLKLWDYMKESLDLR